MPRNILILVAIATTASWGIIGSAAQARPGCRSGAQAKLIGSRHATLSDAAPCKRAPAAKHHAVKRPSHRPAARPTHRVARRVRAPHARGHVSKPAESTALPVSGEPAATSASVLATPCENTELTPEAANLQVVREAVLCLVNRVRAQNDQPPLRLSADLDAAAEGHAGELVQDDYFAHVAPDGETPVDRVRRTGYIPGPSAGYVIGENLAWGTYNLATPASIVAAWVASPGHLANILESQYTETGIGVTAAVPASLGGNAPGATYAQEFGVIVR